MLVSLDPEPCALFEVSRVVADEFRIGHVPLLVGRTTRLPAGVNALVVTADLQARGPGRSSDADRLAGEALAPAIADWLASRLGIRPESAGVVLAGDLWSSERSSPKLGGYGDVAPVWRAFSEGFAWVVGVPGNHDLFEGRPTVPSDLGRTIAVLDAGVSSISGTLIGGVGGCVGKPSRPFRYTEDDQAQRLRSVLAESPEILILHQGPPATGRTRPGATMVESHLAAHEHDLLVICGHEAWSERITSVGRCTVLNSHEAVCVLLPDE